MAVIKEIGLNVRENGIAFSLGAKVQILEDKDVDALIKALLELKPLVKRAKQERLKNELLTLQQKVEDLSNQLKAMEAETKVDAPSIPTPTTNPSPSPTTNPSPSPTTNSSPNPTPTPTPNGGRR
jgi:hypothetical protein